MSVNISRGFFRVWLVFSCLWLLASVWLCTTDIMARWKAIDALTNGPIATGARLLLPGELEARRQASFVADDKIVLEINGTNILIDKSFKSLSYEDENEIVDAVAGKLGLLTHSGPQLNHVFSDKISSAAPWAIGVPAIFLVLGAMMGWILLGFKTPS